MVGAGRTMCGRQTLEMGKFKGCSVVLVQNKTGVRLEVPLHEIALQIEGERKDDLVFHLSTQDGANKALGKWTTDAKLDKHITWYCARHSFSVLLQQKGIDLATVAGMLGKIFSFLNHKFILILKSRIIKVKGRRDSKDLYRPACR